MGTIAEIVIYCVDAKNSILFLPNNIYRLRFIYIPSSMNLIVIILTWCFIRHDKLSNDAKNMWSCVLIYFLTANTQVIHYVYGPLLCLPIIAIFVSVLFANKKLTQWITAASLVSLGMAAFMSAVELRKGDPQLVVDIVLAAIVIIVADIAATLLTNYVAEQFDAVINGSIHQQELISELNLDVLMGIYNRKALYNDIKQLMSEESPPVSHMFLFDIDDFKLINDTYGHIFGDNVLRKLSDIIGGVVDKKDVKAYRYGGEEIILLLSDMSQLSALNICSRIRESFYNVQYDFAPGLHISFSGGLVTYQKGVLPDEWIKSADVLLYKAKSRGKNQIAS